MARDNQRQRTRKDLLQAAARLMAEGRSPTLEEVAEVALVSRATAYRYFPGVEALLLEAALDVTVPAAETLFGPDAPRELIPRLDRVDEVLDKVTTEHELQLRMLLVHSMQQKLRGEEGPVRQNRRLPLIEAAIAPAGLSPGTAGLLASALAVTMGTESMLVFKDVLRASETEGREVRRWMIRALVAAARAAG